MVIGIEGGHSPIIPAYTQVGVTGLETQRVLHLLVPDCELRDATALLDEIAAIKTEEELSSWMGKRRLLPVEQGLLI